MSERSVVALPARDRWFTETRRVHFARCNLCMEEMQPTFHVDFRKGWQAKHEKDCKAVKA